MQLRVNHGHRGNAFFSIARADGPRRDWISQGKELPILNFHSLPGWIANNASETARAVFAEDGGKRVLPIERLGVDVGVRNQAIAADDMVREVRQFAVPARRPNP